MSLSAMAPVPNTKDPLNPSFQYDLRLEIGVKEVSETIPVVSIFRDLVRRMKDVADGNHLVAFTATDKPYVEQKEMLSSEFQKEFQVDKIEGKASKVLLGFKIRTMTKLSDLKTRLIHSYLRPHNLFIREHVGGFDHGVKTYAFGYLKNDHPDHKDLAALNQRFARRVAEVWRNMEKEERNKWRNELPEIVYGSTGIMLPLVFTKERIAASLEGKDKIVTYAIVVSTPAKYGKLAKLILDNILITKKINNLIPFALNRENQAGFYYLAAEQARFMENHRNIPINNVPYDANTMPGIQGQSLTDILHTNPSIQRIAYDATNKKCHVSTTATKYLEVYQWIDKVLRDHKFPYGPSLRPLKYTTNPTYGNIFKDAMSTATDTYSVSTPTPPNAWRNRPPLDISYVPTDNAFPPLPVKKQGTTASTASETLEEDTIQSAISSAIKKLEDKYQAELAQLKSEFQTKLSEVESQMKELGKQVATQTYQALVKEDSPLATKNDQEVLRQDVILIQTQLATLLQLFQPGNSTSAQFPQMNTPSLAHTPPSRKDHESKRTKVTTTPVKMKSLDKYDTQDLSVSSATSSYEDGMEGCDS